MILMGCDGRALRVAGCADCDGYHNVLTSNDCNDNDDHLDYDDRDGYATSDKLNGLAQYTSCNKLPTSNDYATSDKLSD